MTVKRFGNEGTGGQAFLDFDWKTGETYRFAVTAKRLNDRTEYASFFFPPDDQAWRHSVMFSTLTKDTSLKGYYAFWEDFQRHKISTTKTRKDMFSNPAVMLENGAWKPITAARFTGDSNPAVNIDSGLTDDQFWIATGGRLENITNQLNDVMRRSNAKTSKMTGLEPVVKAWHEDTQM